MAKYLLLKHYRGGKPAVNDVPMDQWTPDEVNAHVQYMPDLADRLAESGERRATNIAERDYLARQAAGLRRG